MGTNAFIELPLDQNGKRVDMTQLTVGGQTVYRERNCPADPIDPAGVARVLAQEPASDDYGSVVRPLLSPRTPAKVISVTGNNAQVLSNVPVTLYGWELFSTAAVYTIFVKLYNKATVPNPATDHPVLVLAVQAGTRNAQVVERGVGGFTVGLAMLMVQGIEDTDNTVIAAGDCLVNLLL